MSALTSLHARVERYLVERRRLGFSARSQAYALRSFARHVQTVSHHGPLTVEIMADWARHDSHGSTDPLTWARRLKLLRSFLRWLRQFEPRTEIPDDAIFGRLPERQAPHIYSEREIIDLLAAARRLGPTPGLRGVVFETLFGLIASTGMRISEALSLHNEDVDLKYGMLTIHQTKFGKSRQVPMHLSTVEALRRYRRLRELAGESAQENAPFFVATRGRRRGLPLSTRQVDRVFAGLREQLGWRNRGTHHAPRIHDLRHSFVVRRMVLWQAQGIDIDQAMLSLSTYVGHAMVTNTYWYLSAVPELMALAARRFESFMLQPEVSDA
jgi:integrase